MNDKPAQIGRRPKQLANPTTETRTGESDRRTAGQLLQPMLERRLLSYALAAGAAGAGLVSPAPAVAAIVYTRTHVVMPPGHYNLDLTHDGTDDFVLCNSSQCFPNGFTGFVFFTVSGLNSRDLVLDTNSGGTMIANAAALSKGAKIERSGKFQQVGILAYRTCSASGGPWANATDKFLGLEFQVDGKEHFGWAELSVTGSGCAITATLEGYAYNTVPGEPILAGQTHELEAFLAPRPAPQPATLGLLALGAQGIPIWRRRQTGLTP